MWKFKKATKILIVGEKDPSCLIRQLIEDYSTSFHHDNEVSYLKANIFAPLNNWVTNANLKQAKVLVALSMISNSNPEVEKERDKIIALTVSKVK